MPMSTSSLRNKIKTKVEAATGNAMPALTLDIWEAIAEAIIEEITGNGAVTTSCPAGAGTGTIA